MLEVFTEEIEVIIKQGLANLYWYHNDLKKAWLRAGVPESLCKALFNRVIDGKKLTKRQLMDMLYDEARKMPYNKRLEISRNFVRYLIEHKNFIPQQTNHRIDIAERSALKLKEIIHEQKRLEEKRSTGQKILYKQEKLPAISLQDIQIHFQNIQNQPPQKRGYELEKLFANLMRVNNILVKNSFKIEGEQLDGAIKYDSNFYLVELKWKDKKIDHKEIASLYLKVEGKLDAWGLFISMSGYSDQVLNSLPRGKNLKVILLDGIHLSNVIFGNYSFCELLDYAISEAKLKGNIYCRHDLL